MFRRSWSAVLAVGIFASAALAQTDAPAFEVATIKPSDPNARGVFVRSNPGGRFDVNNMTLKEMIVFAWRVQPYQVTGGPPWLDSAHFDVSAKAERSFQPGELVVAFQSLLADRFQLTNHKETKDLPIYALVLARKDGKLGPQLIESKEGSCTPYDPQKPPAPAEPGKPPDLRCGGMRMSPRELYASSIPISELVPSLARFLGRTVVDKTGLTGKYDVTLHWSPDDMQLAQLPPDAPKPAPSDSSGPSIFTAVQEQLGLKLESQKGPVEMMVIDRAEKPSEN
ncbi:MAG TPA: TIGR03435 family protein [Bryobacteraceae bacterium]|nr:TIGR03435 family protein [Bryobacteraceae bacterium]